MMLAHWAGPATAATASWSITWPSSATVKESAIGTGSCLLPPLGMPPPGTVMTGKTGTKPPHNPAALVAAARGANADARSDGRAGTATALPWFTVAALATGTACANDALPCALCFRLSRCFTLAT